MDQRSSVRGVRYHHPLAYLIGVEGLALMRAWGDEHDETWVRARIAEVRELLDDPRLAEHPGVHVTTDATAAAYAEWASSYDDTGNELLELDLPAIDQILDDLTPGVAIDAGCGTGRLARRLVDRGYSVTGVDSSSAMLARARGRVPGASFVPGDLVDLPLTDATADVVVSGLALTHVSDLGGAYAELARALRPGGTAIVSDVHPELVHRGSVVKGDGPAIAATHRHTVTDYVRAALDAGFSVRGVTELGGGAADAGETVRDVGEWRWWPWTLLDWVPEAARIAWDTPSLIVWHLEKPA